MPSPKNRWNKYVERSSQDWGAVREMFDCEAISKAAMHKAVDIILAVIENGMPGSPSFSYQPHINGDEDRLAITFSYSGGPSGTRVATCLIAIDDYNNGIGITDLWASDFCGDNCGWYPEAVIPSLVFHMLGLRPRNRRYHMFGTVRHD